MKFKSNCLLFSSVLVLCGVQSGNAQPVAPFNGISETPQVQTACNGAPVKRFGFCWVLGEAPTLLDDITLQVGNATPRVKVHNVHSAHVPEKSLHYLKNHT